MQKTTIECGKVIYELKRTFVYIQDIDDFREMCVAVDRLMPQVTMASRIVDVDSFVSLVFFEVHDKISELGKTIAFRYVIPAFLLESMGKQENEYGDFAQKILTAAGKNMMF